LHTFVRLRWLAGLAVVAGSLAGWHWLHLFAGPGKIAALGGSILLYNTLLWLVLRRAAPFGRRTSHADQAPVGTRLLLLAWAQLLLDLVCLTILTVLTGGARSPLLGFFVF